MPGNRDAGVPAAMRRLVLEPLERRMLLSGNVTVLVSGVDLIITGDGDDNNIRISQATVSFDDEFELSSPDGTTINGGVGPRVFDGVFGNILINMGGGSEVVEVEDCVLPGELVFNGGNGDNSLTVDPTTVNGDIHVTNGFGFDYIQIIDVDVLGSITILNGDGGSFIGFDAPPGTNEIAGDVTITNGEGIDELLMFDTTITGNLTVFNGNGGAEPIVALPIDGEVDGSVTLIEDSGIGGNVSITNWDGVDEQGFFGVQVGGSVLISNGNGGTLLDGDGALGALFADEIPFNGSLTMIEEVLIEGDLIIKNGNGIDVQWLGEFGVGGSLLIDNGNGATGLVVPTADGFVSGSETLIGYAEIDGNLTIKNKEGLDLQLFDELLVGGNMSIDNGNGGSEISFFETLETVEVEGNLTIINKAGEDELYLGPLRVGGNLTIDNGVGGSELITGGIAGPHTVGGSMTVTDKTGLSALIGGFEIWGNLTINGGTLGVEALVVDSLIHGNFLFNGKGLTDALTLEGVLINGNATLADGKGAFTFTSEANFGSTQIGGNLTLRNAGGPLIAVINDTGVTGSVSITNGNGGSSIVFDPDTVQGNLTITTGNGADTINLVDLSVLGKTAINTGGGDDVVTAVTSAFGGALGILLGAGQDDTLTLTSITTSSTTFLDGGKGTSDDLTIVGGVFAFAPLYINFESVSIV